MAREYAPIFLDWPTVTRELNAQEKGRLIDAIVLYQAGGDWQEQIKGNERYVFPGYQVRIDRWNEVSEKRAKASKGEQTETNDSKAEQTTAKQNKTPKVKDKVEVKVKDDNDGNSARAWVTDAEAQESLERDRQIEEVAMRWGLPCKEGHMIQARDLAQDYSMPWLLRAIETAGKGKEQTWRYVDGILRSWKENGGPDAPRKQQASPAKVVSAQQYNQRQYQPGELDAIGDDLVEEARKQRGQTA